MRKLSEEEIKKLVDKTLRSPENMIKMLQKHGRGATWQIDHGCLHLDFDSRYNSTWNADILALFPLDYPVAITSYKGRIFAHCLEWNTDLDGLGTHEILEQIVEKYVDTEAVRKNKLI